MSSTLKKAKPFLELLLENSTPLNQKHALLFSACDFQANAVVEILYNLTAGVIPLSKTTKQLLLKYRKLIQGIIKGSIKGRAKRIRLKYKNICDILVSVRSIVLGLIA